MRSRGGGGGGVRASPLFSAKIKYFCNLYKFPLLDAPVKMDSYSVGWGCRSRPTRYVDYFLISRALKLVSHQTISPPTTKSADFSGQKKSADLFTNFFSSCR